jgi:hypothetical protein
LPPPGSFLCQLVGFAISFLWQMLNGESLKVPFHLSHFRKVLNQFRLFGLTLLFHMIFDDLGIALHKKIAGSQGSHFSEAKQERLILGSVVGASIGWI